LAALTLGNQVSIFLGNGDGTFQAPVQYPGGGELAAGDMNRDGNLDLLSGNLLLLGNGDGTFQPGVSITSVASENPVIADLNGDGKLDVIFNTAFGFVIFTGNGDGTFNQGNSYGTDYAPSSMTVGDLNGDGILDIVGDGALGCCAQLSILLGNGDGTFQPSTNTGLVPYLDSGVTFADFNADGRLDMAFVYGFAYGVAVELGTTVQFSPISLAFGTVNIGNTSPAQSVTVTNAATTTLPISSVTIGGAFATQFILASNNCGPSLASNASCTVSVSCVPTLSGNLSASLLFTDGAPASPQQVLMTCLGNGTMPSAQFSPTSLTFSSQAIGTTSPPQNVKLSSTGNAPLSATAVIVGINPDDFSLNFGACSGIVEPGMSCTFSVAFTPSETGARIAQVAITSNSQNSPQYIPLTGTGSPNLGLVVPSGGSSSATVAAGSTASYTLSIGGAGTSGTAILTCAGAPIDATCTVPASEDLSATSATKFTVSVKTAARTTASRIRSNPLRGWVWAMVLVGIGVLPSRKSRGSRLERLSRLPLLLILFLASCGGGGSGAGPGSTGTPVGTYTLTVTAAVGNTTQPVMLTLIVK
jgi:hypothetical protein